MVIEHVKRNVPSVILENDCLQKIVEPPIKMVGGEQEACMEKYIGLWIDHEKAIVVALDHGTETRRRIESHVKGRVRLSGGSRSSTPYGPQDVATERRIEARREHHLHEYYQKVVHEVRDAEKIFIMGPGEAKGELKKEIEKSKTLSFKIAGVQTADTMTDNQIAAMVRNFFHLKRK
jgi:hypothetical protein